MWNGSGCIWQWSGQAHGPPGWTVWKDRGEEGKEKEGAEEGGVEGEEGPTWWKTESGFECPAYAVYQTVCKAWLARLSLYSTVQQAQGIAPVSNRAERRQRS